MYFTKSISICQDRVIFKKIALFAKLALYWARLHYILEKIALYLVKTLYIQQD